MEQYICKIATAQEMEKNWKYLIDIHPDDCRWKVFRDNTRKNMEDGSSIIYYGILNGEIISEATAMLKNLDVQNTDGLVDDDTIYLSGFRTKKEYQGKGYFSKLFKFMENDLKARGYRTLTLGVEPCEVKNIMMYFKFGFTNFIKSEYVIEPSVKEDGESAKILVNFYSKSLDNSNEQVENNKKGKVIALCGKIASGKTYYASQIKEKENATVFSIDELTFYMFDNRRGEDYTDLSKRATNYLCKKSAEIAKNGGKVILDLGLWRSEERKYISEYFKSRGINVEIHYIEIDDDSWEKNIKDRNERIDSGNRGLDFYVTDTLKEKVLKNWEEPKKEEIDVWYKVRRIH